MQLPDTWHAGLRNSANRLQATDPAGDHYVSAEASRAGVRLTTEVESESPNFLVKSSRPGLDGRMERYVFVVRVTVAESELQAGDEIHVVYGDTRGGSRGMRAAIVSTRPEPILAAVDRDRDAAFEPVSREATLTANSGIAAALRLSSPATLVVGEPATLHLAAVDLYENPVTQFRDEVALRVLQGDVELPAAVRLDPGRGHRTVSFTPRGPGIVRLEAVTRAGILRTRTNPMQVFAEAPAERIYWGDLHSHTRHSFDGVGDGVFDYARYLRLRVGLPRRDRPQPDRRRRVHPRARTAGLGRVPGSHRGELRTGRVRDPARLRGVVPLSVRTPQRVLPRRAGPAPLAPQTVTLPELWAQLEAGQALTIPHHTGKFPAPLTTDAHDPERRRNFEIYSAHGLSESYDPTHPLAFEQSDFTNYSTSAPDGLTAHDMWARGLVLSTIAASDDHRAHPGQPHWGVAAVRAPKLTREAIFDALYARRTYGTTGARILLDFTVDGTPMGSETTADGPPRLHVAAHGTDVIESVQVLRFSKAEGGFSVLFDLEPDALDFSWSGVDGGFRDDAVYYVRLRQRGHIRGRTVMAWSSPVWVTRRR